MKTKLLLLSLTLLLTGVLVGSTRPPDTCRTYLFLDLAPGIARQAPSLEWNRFVPSLRFGVSAELTIATDFTARDSKMNYNLATIYEGSGFTAQAGCLVRLTNPKKGRICQLSLQYSAQYSAITKHLFTSYDVPSNYNNVPVIDLPELYTENQTEMLCHIFRFRLACHLAKHIGLAWSLGIRTGRGSTADVPSAYLPSSGIPQYETRSFRVYGGDHHIKLYYRF